jgi:DNA-binding transcriptional MocR family regulator
MIAVDKTATDYLYRQVTDLITEQIASGALRVGDRLPSLRRLSGRLSVSVPTVRQAYVELERQGRVESRPQSGFYVRAEDRNPMVSPGVCKNCQPQQVRCKSLIDRVYAGIHQPGVVPFGIANPTMARPAVKGLNRAMKRVMTRAEERSIGYAPSDGEPTLKRQIAYRYLELGGKVEPDEVIISNGGQEALALALMAVAGKGDIIAVETPTYHGALELIESMGMLALEIKTCPRDGLSLSALRSAIDKHRIKACLFASSLNNPLGSATPDEHREAMVEMLEARDIPLIEDDVYGDLMFDESRPKPARFFSRKNLVLTCGSFSKTVAPGYRIGWILAGQFDDRVRTLKRAFSCSCGLLQQMTLTEYLATGEYDRHLKALRPVLKCNAERMSAMISRYFPSGTGVSRPKGGSVLWLELPGNIDGIQLFEHALENSISICPGTLYSPSRRYRNFVRLSFGHPWTDQIDAAIRRLGELVGECA